MKDNKESFQRSLGNSVPKETSHTPGVGKGQFKDSPRGGVVTNINLKTYKVISKSPRG